MLVTANLTSCHGLGLKKEGQLAGKRAPYEKIDGDPIISHLILIVEDEQDAVEIMEYNLNKAGLQTRSAMAGKEALEQAFQEPLPDLALLDLMLPDISGTEVCRQLRADERTRDTPVIMLTVKGEEIDRVVGCEVGVDDYVVKPFFIRELILRIGATIR